jgi:galactokinase
VALVEVQRAEEAAASITEVYQHTTGRAGAAYVCTPSDGVHARWVV